MLRVVLDVDGQTRTVAHELYNAKKLKASSYLALVRATMTFTNSHTLGEVKDWPVTVQIDTDNSIVDYKLMQRT